ncbi:hypothetical protein ACQP3L_38230, partial [Escherichia coli]
LCGGVPAGVIQGSKHLQEMKIENSVYTEFINLCLTYGSLMPGGSLSKYLKHSAIWEHISRQKPVQ